MRKAFTLIEVVVALGILAVILSFAGVIFRVSVESQRMAMANAEVMQKLRIITEQLDADFKSGAFRPFQYPYSYDYDVSASTRPFTAGGSATTENSDVLVIFASGDFRSTGQYANKTIVGNVAWIFYGQPDPNSYARPPLPREKVLLRRQTILGSASGSDPRGEFYNLSPQQWWANPPIDRKDWKGRPVIDPNDVQQNLPMYLVQGVDNFTIHYLDAGEQPGTQGLRWLRPVDDPSITGINPKAFRFTFTLYDSRGILKQGRTFTHIVAWDNIVAGNS